MPNHPQGGSGSRPSWRGSAAGPPSALLRWTARAALTAIALGLMAFFLWAVLRSPTTTQTLLVEQVVDYDGVRQEFPPGSFFVASDDERYFGQRTAAVRFTRSALSGELPTSVRIEDPLVVCLAGHILGDDVLDPDSDVDPLLTELLQKVSQHRAPIKLLVIDAGGITSDSSRGVLLNRFASQLTSAVKSVADPKLFVLLSHGTGESSWLVPAGRRSVFCDTVSRALRGEADETKHGGNGDAQVDLAEWTSYVQWRVPAWYARHAPEFTSTPVLLQGGRGEVSPQSLLANSELRSIALARVVPQAGSTDGPAPKPAPQAKPATKSALILRMGGRRFGLAQAAPTTTAAQPPATTLPAAPPGATPAPSVDVAPEKPPETIEQFLEELWKLRDELEARGEPGKSPWDLGPLQWRVFQDGLVTNEVRHRLGRLDPGKLRQNLERLHAAVLSIRGTQTAVAETSPVAPVAAAPREEDRIPGALAQLREAQVRSDRDWSDYRAHGNLPGDFRVALRKLQRTLDRLPAYRTYCGIAPFQSADLCSRVETVHRSVAQALAMLQTDHMDADGVTRFVSTVADIADEMALRDELVGAALSGSLIDVERLLATPLPTAPQRHDLLARAGKLSDPKSLWIEAPGIQAGAPTIEPNSQKWQALEPWINAVASWAELLASASGPPRDRAARGASPIHWDSVAKLGTEAQDSYARLKVEHDRLGGSRSKHYWQTFLIESRDFRPLRSGESQLVPVPPWPSYDAGPMQIVIESPSELRLTPRFGAASKEVELVLPMRFSGTQPRELTLEISYPPERIELTWQGPNGNLDRLAVNSGESYSRSLTIEEPVRLWARTRLDQLPADCVLRVVARAEADGKSTDETVEIPLRLGQPDAQISLAGVPVDDSSEALRLRCFPGVTTFELAVSNRSQRRLSNLMLEVWAREPNSNDAGQLLAAGNISELAPSSDALAVLLKAVKPAPPAEGAPAVIGPLDLADLQLVCEVWEPAPAPMEPPVAGAAPAAPAARLLLVRRGLQREPWAPADYLKPTFTWTSERQLAVQLAAQHDPPQLPDGGSVVGLNLARSTPGISSAVPEVTITSKASAVLEIPVAPENFPDANSLRVVLDADRYSRAFVYDVPFDRGSGARALADAEVQLDVRLIPPAGTSADDAKKFAEATAPLIERESRRVFMRPDQRLSVTAWADVPYSAFHGEVRDVLSLGFDDNDNGRIGQDERQFTAQHERDVRAQFQGVDPKSGGLQLLHTVSDPRVDDLRLPIGRKTPVNLLAEVRLQGRDEPARGSWEVVIDGRGPDVTDVETLRAEKGQKPNATVTVSDPGPASGVATVDVALWRQGLKEPKWIAALEVPERPGVWQAPLDTAESALGSYELHVRATDRVDNDPTIERFPRAVVILEPPPMPKPEDLTKPNQVIVVLTLGGKIPQKAEARLLKDDKIVTKAKGNAAGRCVFPEVLPGSYLLEATGRTPAGAEYSLDEALTVEVKAPPAPPAQVSGDLSKYVP